MCCSYICVHFQVTALKKLLTELQTGHFVIVHGMNGCGKSSLVVEVLNDPLILMQCFEVSSYLKNNIYFIQILCYHNNRY